MLDPEFEPPLAKPARPCRGRKIAAACVILAGVGLLWPSSGGPRRYTCAVCRLDRVDHAFLGRRWSEYEESDCSEWYAAHVERSHTHIWASHGFCRRFGIPGIYGGYACNVGDPIAMYPKFWQLRVYQRFDDPLKAKSLFLRFDQAMRESPGLMDGLCEWADSSDTEPWDEWWPKQRKKADGDG